MVLAERPRPLQELNEILGRSNGIVIMTPPRDSKDAQASLATMVSALKPKHKVPAFSVLVLLPLSSLMADLPAAAWTTGTMRCAELLACAYSNHSKNCRSEHLAWCSCSLIAPCGLPDSAYVLQMLIAESYGGMDEPVDTLITSCVDAGADTSLEPLRVKSTPTENTYQACPASHHFVGALQQGP